MELETHPATPPLQIAGATNAFDCLFQQNRNRRSSLFPPTPTHMMSGTSGWPRTLPVRFPANSGTLLRHRVGRVNWKASDQFLGLILCRETQRLTGHLKRKRVQRVATAMDYEWR